LLLLDSTAKSLVIHDSTSEDGGKGTVSLPSILALAGKEGGTPPHGLETSLKKRHVWLRGWIGTLVLTPTFSSGNHCPNVGGGRNTGGGRTGPHFIYQTGTLNQCF